MLGRIISMLKEFNIDVVSCISLERCEAVRPYLLERCGIREGSAVIFAVPYLTEVSFGERNISSYAVSRDYHLFFRRLFDEILPVLRSEYPENTFAGFTDHSPINEIRAAASAGLGVIGKNHLLITEKYSSYVFLGEIITDARLDCGNVGEIKYCEGCGKCIRACPMMTGGTECLSSLTQKKGTLTPSEAEAILKSGCAWGCDACQEACPHTDRALERGTLFTPIEFFRISTTPRISTREIEEMGAEDFSERAYSWRGKATILRNLKILEGEED